MAITDLDGSAPVTDAVILTFCALLRKCFPSKLSTFCCTMNVTDVRNSSTSQSEAMFIHNAVTGEALCSWAVSTLLLMIISSVLNTWNLLALLAHQRRRPWTSWYVLLAHLYVIDLFCSSILYTSNVANISFPYWVIWDDRVFCQIIGFICTYSAICSSTSICAMAILRVYTAFHRRLSALILHRKVRKFLVLLFAFIHLISFLASASAYVTSSRGEIDPPYDLCGHDPYDDSHSYGAQIVKMTAWAFLPTVVTAVCYGQVHRLLRKEKNSRSQRDSAQQRRQRSAPPSSPQREVQCLQVLSYRLVVMILLKVVVHYPIAFFYLLRSGEASKPGIHLLVLTLHFSSTFFNAVRKLKRQRKSSFDRSNL
ncbi:hypothetical protein RvY_06287-2 [Ramazzottius varieornatus]|uniref:G-protein coupled receptors family 1 profile domain-containing protein n=1 Tax=Ramazzottius varieornatus TaxID=947166 RepID=A0A1D1UY14_RAMVA|nr:hypothetical protein RvY_06287-2 [Ramazzottius varieornatus]